MKKQYLVIGSNNFWYAIENSLKDAKKTMHIVKSDNGAFSDPETGHTPDVPENVYIYEAKEIKSI
jgi:hypothetical protein